jgi:uncharacterized membrane protein
MRLLEFQVINWFKLLGMPTIASRTIINAIKNHTDYPALTACTDTLDMLGVQYSAVVVDKENTNKITYPILAHTNANGGELQLITNATELTSAFMEQWTGVAIMATGRGFTNNEANTKAYEKEQQQKLYQTLAFAVGGLLLASSIGYAFYYNHYFNILYTLLSAIGLAISYLIVQKELGITNTVTEKLCSVTKETDCNTVINSKAATLFWGLKWSDVGIIFFGASLLLFIVASFSFANINTVFTCISIAAIPFTIYSVYYQWQVAKKWCTLCLLTVAVLWLQAIAAVALGNFNIALSIIPSILTITSFFAFSTVLWLLGIKPLLFINRKQEQQINALNRFKNNPVVFVNNLLAEKQLYMPNHEQELQLANKDATLQLVVACNPYCAPCATAHTALHNMLQYAGEVVSLKVIFLIDAEKPEDIRTHAVQLLYNTISLNGGLENNKVVKDVLHIWYNTMEEEKFKAEIKQHTTLKLPQANEENVVLSPAMAPQKDSWTDAIEYTPTLIINGYILPKTYRIHDFTKIVNTLVNEETLMERLTKNYSYNA